MQASRQTDGTTPRRMAETDSPMADRRQTKQTGRERRVKEGEREREEERGDKTIDEEEEDEEKADERLRA